jgi:hypothetical protein
MIARFLAERGSRISVRAPLGNDLVKDLLYSWFQLLMRYLDVGAAHGKPVCLGYSRKSNVDATTYSGWSEPSIPVGSFTTGWSSFASTND